MKRTITLKLLAAGIVLSGAPVLSLQAQTQSADGLINKLVQKGILTEQEGKDLLAENATQTNLLSASKWKLSNAFKNIELFGDVRFRYEYRGVDNPPGGDLSPEKTFMRERFRYALRLGLRGDLYDDFYYGLRLETSTNPRSPWVTFGDDSQPTPSDKHSDGINVGQAYVGWRPTPWYEMTVGKMPMPLYVTPMIWDADINPEGAVEKFKTSFGPADLFANFGQFMYQDRNPDVATPSSDTFLLAWQVGANVNLRTNLNFKIAPVLYNYTGVGSGGGVNKPFSGEGAPNGLNPNVTSFHEGARTVSLNQNGINDLLVLETPAELNLKLGRYNARLFGDFAYNFYGEDRARTAALVAGLPHAYTDETKAYQVGFGFGTAGLNYGPTSGVVYGSGSKKHAWEARAYWQHVEQYAADVNLLDSDFFEGRSNLEGIYGALAYCLTDSIIATFRYGYANRINPELGTGGSNLDIPQINPIKGYHLIQLDLAWRF